MARSRAAAFLVGARGSRLSRAQTEGAVAFLAQAFPGTAYRVVAVETPGDRDLATPIEASAPDFFTRDLDDAVRAGRLDFAVHSAKDLPARLADDLDWFWLPNREDPRDAWVVRAGVSLAAARRRRTFTVGISSERRRAYAAARFPKARLLPIRGAIDARLDQLRAGRFDAVLMAMAGLRRLYPEGAPGVVCEPIPLAELTPPEAQGALAVVFRAGDARLLAMRARFVKAVRFVSAGVGDAGLCTVAGRRDLALADTVLYDDLLGKALLDDPSASPGRRLLPVGKRCGAHTMKQAEITRLICDEARKGRRVVRLKGGDAGLFGRLAEETDALAALKIPFLVRPGVSALTAGTTGTGLLLTRRGESTGFAVYTPSRAEDAPPGRPAPPAPLVLFMATRVLEDEARALVRRGWAPETPCALVLDAGGPGEDVRTMTLATARNLAGEARPGLFVVGAPAAHRWPANGPLGGRRVLVTCSDAVQEKAAAAVEDGGGRPLRWPLIRLVPRPLAVDPAAYDALVLTSPSAVRLFFAACPCDRRRLPALYTCGAGTDAALRAFGVSSDVLPAADFSAEGLVAEIAKRDLTGRRVLRLRSAKAGPAVARALRRAGARVDDVVLYDNVFCAPGAALPPFDDVFFASASAVASFLAQYGAAKLRGKGIFVMGRPTRAALPAALARGARCLGPGAKCLVPGAKCLVPGTDGRLFPHQAPSTRHLAPSTRHPAPNMI